MATLTLNCPTCGRPAKIQSQFTAAGLVHYIYQCGHLEVKKDSFKEESKETPQGVFDATLAKLNESTFNLDEALLLAEEVSRMESEGYFQYPPILPKIPAEFWALNSCQEYFCKECNETHTKKHAYRFQRQGVEFIEKALPTYGGSLIADEMGLGKTIQTLLLLRKHFKALTPCLIVVKGSTLLQWQNEVHEWMTEKFSDCIPVTDRIHLIPGMKSYIISMDLLGAKGVIDTIAKLGIKSIILDECQNFKDGDSLRTRSLIKIIKNATASSGQKPAILALSGTPIKNRITEYFTILNLLDPRTFYSYAGFCKTWLWKNEKGFYTKLDSYMVDHFQEVTSRYILRRRKAEVLKDLPPLTRDFQYIDITDPIAKKSYNQNVDLLKNFLNTAERIDATSLLGWFARMRAITGAAKAEHAVSWTKDFIESTDASLAIGIHHKAVRDTLHLVFSNQGLEPLKLSGEDNVYVKNEVQTKFNSGESRMLIINMLAGGVGLNLQSCSNALIMELPWNPADMEQFIGRFHRNGQQNPVTATYLIARGTIDEFMHKLIYEKSLMSTQAGINIAPGGENPEGNPEFLREFAEFISNHKI